MLVVGERDPVAARESGRPGAEHVPGDESEHRDGDKRGRGDEDAPDGSHAAFLTASSLRSTGRLRKRTPVAAKSALASAGAAIEVPGSPMPPGACAVPDQMNVDRRRLIDPHHPIIVEVALLHPPFGERDLIVERRGEPEDEAALDLRLDAVRIDNLAAIDRRRHAADRDLAVGVDLGLEDRRDIRAEHALAGHPASGPRGKRAAPPRLLGGEIEAGEKPRLLRQMRAAEGDPILPRGVRELVDEALDDEDIVAGTDAAPEAGRNAGRLGANIFDVKVRRVVGNIDGAVDRIDVDAVLEGRRQPARHDGGTGDFVVPGRDPAVGEACGEAIEIEWPVEGLLDVLFARPDHLDRAVYLLRDAHRLGDVVDLEPPAEAAADQMIVDDDLLERKARHLAQRSPACAR